MNKNNLIFDWSDVETQRGWMGVSILIAVLGLVFFLSVIHVKFDFKKVASIKSASVFYLPDHEDGRSWLIKANEEGPFPGGMEINGMDDPFEEFGRGSIGKDDSWTPAELPLFHLESQAEIKTTEWRFLLNLSKDGRVRECLLLSGGDDSGSTDISTWLKGLQFQKDAEAERWMGLRVELLNERNYGANPK
jgi:hypothetical protein